MEARTKESTPVTREEVTCVGCKMLALLDENKRCEFCRREYRPEPIPYTWRDMPWIGFLIIAAIVGVFIATVVFLPGRI